MSIKKTFSSNIMVLGLYRLEDNWIILLKPYNPSVCLSFRVQRERCRKLKFAFVVLLEKAS